MDTKAAIEDFLAGDVYAVAGASGDRSKYGNKVLRCYLQHGRTAIPVHPHETEIEGVFCVPNLGSLTVDVHGLSIVTPPAVTEQLVDDAARAGIRRIWMQPGAESPEAIQAAREADIQVIAGGPCILVAMGYRE